jgi:hypothetical protein
MYVCTALTCCIIIIQVEHLGAAGLGVFPSSVLKVIWNFDSVSGSKYRRKKMRFRIRTRVSASTEVSIPVMFYHKQYDTEAAQHIIQYNTVPYITLRVNIIPVQ